MMIYKTLHIKLKIKSARPRTKTGRGKLSSSCSIRDTRRVTSADMKMLFDTSIQIVIASTINNTKTPGKRLRVKTNRTSFLHGSCNG